MNPSSGSALNKGNQGLIRSTTPPLDIPVEKAMAQCPIDDDDGKMNPSSGSALNKENQGLIWSATPPLDIPVKEAMAECPIDDDDTSETVMKQVPQKKSPVAKKTDVVPVGQEDIVFETFYHRSGKEIQCMYLGNTRYYLHDWGSKEWQLFPKRWYNEGLLITNNVLKEDNEAEASQTSQQSRGAASGSKVRVGGGGRGRGEAQQETSRSRPNGDDREGILNHPIKGKIPTYIYQRKHNVHCFYDKNEGQWMRMPIGWELHHEMVGRLVNQVEEMLPGWADRGDILALLRQCNYDIDECISTYLRLENDPWLKVAKTSKDVKDNKEKDERIIELEKKVKKLENELNKDKKERREAERILIDRQANTLPIMAEGELSDDQSSVDGAKLQSLDSHQLECPICLETLKQPKSLPCLHSFCLECLDSYITKELSDKIASGASFSCPVCRKVTELTKQTEAKESWAEQFPTNDLAAEMIQRVRMCKPCEMKENLNVLAEFWCKGNNSYFCSDCKINHHDLIHEECECQDITQLNGSVKLQQKTSGNGCERHNEKIEYYCEDHKLFGCSKCIIVDHRKCEVVTSTEDFWDKWRNTSQIDDLLQELQRSAEAMEILIKDVGEQLKLITQDQDTAFQSLTEIRKKIDERFDVLHKDLRDKLISSFKKERENLEKTRQKCEELMFAMQNTLTSWKIVALKKDVVWNISLFQRGQLEVESCKELIQELEKSYRSTSIKHEYDTDILSVDTNTSLTLGKIIVDQQPRKLPSTYSTWSDGPGEL